MSYDYAQLRGSLFDEAGQRDLLAVRDAAAELLARAGAATMKCILDRAAVGGDSWRQLALVDRLVELHDLLEVSGPGVAAQDRVFVGHGRLQFLVEGFDRRSSLCASARAR